MLAFGRLYARLANTLLRFPLCMFCSMRARPAFRTAPRIALTSAPACAARPAPRHRMVVPVTKKQVVVCCDGSWCGDTAGTVSNIKLLADCFAGKVLHARMARATWLPPAPCAHMHFVQSRHAADAAPLPHCRSPTCMQPGLAACGACAPFVPARHTKRAMHTLWLLSHAMSVAVRQVLEQDSDYLCERTKDGVVVKYYEGIGLAGSFQDYIVNGAIADDIAAACTAAYRFIATQFEEGSEVWMFGLSRGAHTVRSVCGMINNW